MFPRRTGAALALVLFPTVAVVAAGALTTGAAGAQGLCICPLCAFGQEKMYRQSSESMAPALRPGDCLRVTLGAKGMAAGDVVAYRTANDTEHLMRVVALAGQRIAVAEGVPVIDGQPARRMALGDFQIPGPCDGDSGCMLRRFRETLPDGRDYDVLDAGRGGLIDDMAEVTVPDGHVFVMGDNRDNAMDSRVSPALGGPGMVPLGAVVGVMIRPAAVIPH